MDRRTQSRTWSGACAALLVCLASAAQAATVTVTQGEVLVSRGDGYQPVRGNAEVLAGDSVVSKPGSAAKISFSDGCSIFLATGMVYSVPPEPPCGVQNASATTSSPTPGNWTPGTQTVAGENWTAGTQTIAAAEPTNYMPYLLGAVAVGGVAAGVAALGGGSGSGSPTSP